MIKNRVISRITHRFFRNYTTKKKLIVIPEEQVLDDIANSKYKPRNHLGIQKPRVVMLPDALIKAVQNATEDQPIKALIEDSEVLVRHLKGKQIPLEQQELARITQEIKARVMNRYGQVEIQDEAKNRERQLMIRDKINTQLKEKIYNWKPVNYDEYNSLLYLFGRLAPEYAVLVKIFAEIVDRDPSFKPKSLFDFGSGLGTVTWAAILYWKKTIFEYFNVDSSVHMNDLAQLLLQNGRSTKRIDLKGVFYRQFLPASNTSYDLVVSAYSLLELPSRQARFETLLNLWNKTQNYLVLVEQGTNAGFEVINEARDFILATTKTKAHVFSPCPHDQVCPRFVANDETPCNFEILYYRLPVGKISEHRRELYSYVVLKKGERGDDQWPRVVREALVRSKHTICRMCTKEGKLEEIIFTAAKHGKVMYHCARSTKWGDRLPIKLEDNRNDEE